MRKPIRSIVTLLSVTVAFILFGLMIGLNTTMDLMEQRAHVDRVWTLPRFDMNGFPIAVARRIEKLPGVKNVTVMYYLQGYIADPKNRTSIFFLDDEYGRIFPDWGPTLEQWEIIRRDRTAIIMSRIQAERFHKKVGDIYTVISPGTAKVDGSKTWTFKVAGIGAEVSQNPGGYIIGNYDYYDQSVPLADRGKISEVDLLAADSKQVAALAARIDGLFANSGNPTQSQPEQTIYSINNNYGGMDVKTVTRDIALAGLLMMFLLTASVIAKSVRERFAEFATLKTIGYSDSAIVGLVVAEAALPCLLGAACGVAVAAWLAQLLPALMPPMFGIPTPTMSPAVFLWAQISACALALASTVLPVLRLRRMDIASALSGRA